MKRLVLMTLGLMLANFAQALEIGDLDGTWLEVGYRCVGEKAFKARPFPGKKTFAFDKGSYTHRYAPKPPSACAYVESSGSLVWSSSAKSRWVNIFAVPDTLKSVTCDMGNSITLADDFVIDPAKGNLWLTLESLDGATYMIVAGDPGYIDTSCDYPIVERVYGKQ